MIVRDGELNAHHQRFDAGDQQKDERVDDVQNAELLVVDGDHPAMQPLQHAPAPRDAALRREMPAIGKVWSPSRLPSVQSGQVRHELRRSARSLSCMAGISAPGLKCSDRRSTHADSPAYSAAAPAAIVARLIRWVRSGPKRARRRGAGNGVAVDAGLGFKDVPARAPRCRILRAGLLLLLHPRGKLLRACRRRRGSASWRARRRRTARTGRDTSPAARGSIHISLGWLGIRSVLPASCGTQKL